MVKLVFNAPPLPETVPAADIEITVTVGRSKTEMRWSDRRTMRFGDLCSMLSDAPVGNKDGACYTPATFRSYARRRDQADIIGVAVIDADCGHTAEEIADALRRNGWEGLIHSTYSHLTDQTDVAVSAFDKWREATGSDDAERFMLEKKGYLPHVVSGAYIADERAGNYVIQHRPCPKFRVLLPLARPWQASDYSTQDNANAIWAERIGALAHALGLHHDQSCTDTSRLFYTARRRDRDQPFIAQVITGDACDIWALPEAPHRGDATMAAPNLFNQPQRSTAAPQPRMAATGDKTFRGSDGQQIDLTTWAVGYAERFEVAGALRSRMPGVFGSRRTGVKFHIECPFDDEHTHVNDRTGTFLVNASDIKTAGMPSLNSGFYIGCKHNSCAARDRLDFLKGMLAKGWLAIHDLTNPAFLIQESYDIDPVDSARIIEGMRRRDAAKPPEAAGNIPAALLASLPGIMAPFVDYMLATSHKPQPILALGATLAAMSAAVGRKVELEGWGTRPNVYIVGIAHSGAGKERPMTAVKDVMKRAGVLEKMLGAEKLASDAGLVREAKEKPAHVMLLDEVGYLLASTGDRNSGTHVKDIIPTLLTLYSSSRTVYKSKSYADAERNFIVDQPSVSMFGASTPSKLYGALRSEDISAGLLSRVVIFDAGDHDPEQEMPPGAPIPETVVEWFKAWDEAPLNSNPLAMEGGIPVIAPRIVGMTEGAKTIFKAFSGEMHRAKIEARKDGLDSLYVRSLENALKFALIRATAEGPGSMLVNEATARWAVDLSRAVTEHMAGIARDHIADNSHQRNLAVFRDVIKKAGPRGCTDKELRRKKACQVPKREFDDILGFLTSAGEIQLINVNEGRTKTNGVAVKARTAYVWTSDIADDDAGDS